MAESLERSPNFSIYQLLQFTPTYIINTMSEIGYDSEAEKYAHFDSERIDTLKKEKTQATFTNKEEKDSQIIQISETLKRNLKLSQAYKENPNIEPFYQECASSVWEACELLKIPLPRIRIGKEDPDAVGNANLDYEIRITPDYIRERLGSFSYFDKLDLKSFFFHESYHLWQYIHFPNSAQKETDSWRLEVGALLFEEKFLKGVSPKTPKEFVAKMLKMAETRGQLIAEKTKNK